MLLTMLEIQRIKMEDFACDGGVVVVVVAKERKKIWGIELVDLYLLAGSRLLA